jgi:hypothetical protein
VSVGSKATVVVVGAASGTSCRITVRWPTATKELAPTLADAEGRASWTWTVSRQITPAGTWPMSVSCGGSSVSTSFTVS